MAGPVDIPRWAAQMDGHQLARKGEPQNPAYRPAHRLNRVPDVGAMAVSR